MKKNLILALAVAAAVASCQKDMEPVSIQQATDTAISFSAYTGTAVTRGEIDSAKVAKDSIGVFAFYQGTETFNTHKLATPNFMYNQKVKTSDGSYSPIKYWPNNTNDKLSFFAYSPYDSEKSWEDMGITTDVNGNKMTVTFPINQDVADQIDQLWADPTFNMTKPNNTGKVTFNFRHITSQISLYVGVERDSAYQKSTYWNDKKTTITVNSVEFKGLKDLITYKYDLTKTPVTKDSTYTGEQDITLTSDNFDAEGKLIDSLHWAKKDLSSHWVAKETGDTCYKHLTDSVNGYMFVAPQEFTDGKNDFVFTYTVKTEDAKNAANNSEIKNVIKADLYDILSTAGNKFEAGKAYKIYCLIGMTSVKFEVTAADWTDATGSPYQINVPANN